MTEKRRPYPYQNVPFKYQDNDDPLSGNGQAVRNATEAQRQGYQKDILLDLEAVKKKLRYNGYELDEENLDVKLVAEPRFNQLKGITPIPNQLQVIPKAYADLYKRRDLLGILSDPNLTEEYPNFDMLAKCLYDPLAPSRNLERVIEWSKEWTPPEIEVSDKNYLGKTPKYRAHGGTAKILPTRDQFSPAVRNLKFGDIFTIFAGSQLEQMKLFLGRVCVGHSGTTDKFTKKKLHHTYRNIMVVDGSYPGQGKSTLFNWLTDALSLAGYDVCKSVPALAGRFNLRTALTSDLSYRDDETADNLKKELASPVAKVMATQDWIATEEKGVDAVPTKCTTAMLINANRLGRSIFWNLDEGSRSRMALCETVPEGVLPESELPYHKIPRMARELDVDISTIMLWALRLATDEFLLYCNENAHKLEARVKELESSSNKSNADPLDGVMSALVLGNLIANPDKPLSPKLNINTLNNGIKGMMMLKQSVEFGTVAYNLLASLKEVNNRLVIPGWHPVQGLKMVDPASLPRAYELSQNISRMGSPNQRICEVLECLSLDDGNQCYGKSNVVIPRWNQLVSNAFTFNRLKALAREITEGESLNWKDLAVDIDYDLDIFWNLP